MFDKKGFGSVVSTLIMFIAIVGVTTGMVISFQQYVSQTQSSLSNQNELANNKLKTSLSITNTNYNSSAPELYVYVKNVGETVLRADRFDIFLDDLYITSYSVVYANNDSKNMTLMELQETAKFIIPTTLVSGTHEVKLVSEYGVGTTDEFNS